MRGVFVFENDERFGLLRQDGAGGGDVYAGTEMVQEDVTYSIYVLLHEFRAHTRLQSMEVVCCCGKDGDAIANNSSRDFKFGP